MKQRLLKAKITKQAHAFKNSTCSYSVEIFNSFNPELQLKNKPKSLGNELRDFTFIITLFLKFF